MLASSFEGNLRAIAPANTGAPRYNYTGDPYFTDGLRVVIFLSETDVAFDDIVSLEWEQQSRGAVLNEF